MKQFSLSITLLLGLFCSLIANVKYIDNYLDTVQLKTGEDRYLYLAEHLKELNKYHIDTIAFFAREADAFGSGSKNNRVLGLSRLFACSNHRIHRRFNEAIEEAKVAEQLLGDERDSINLARLYNELGSIYWQLSLREESLNYFNKAIQLTEFKVWDIYFTAKVNMANALTFREPKTAKKIFLELLKETPPSKLNQKAILFNLLFIPIAVSRDSLRMFMDSAQYYNKLTQNIESQIIYFFNESKWEHIHYRIDSSIAYTKKALRLAKRSKDLSRIAVCYRFLLTRNFVKEDYEQAEVYLDSLSNILASDQALYKKMYKNYVMMRIELHAKRNEYKQSIELMRNWFFHDDSTDKAENAQRIFALQTEFDTKEKAWQIKQLQEKDALQEARLEQTIALAIGGVLSLTAILLLLFMKRRQDRMKIEQERAQLQWAIESERKEKERVRVESHYKSQQLISKSLEISKKNEFLENVQQELGQTVSKLQIEDQQKLRRLHQLIRLNQQSDKEWQEIRHYFDQLDPTFFTNLKQKHGRFSQSEQRLLALIYLKLDTKDCANILNISTNSVKTARYRLKKRLALRAEESLDEYVQQVKPHSN